MTWEELIKVLQKEMLLEPEEVYDILKALNEIKKAKK